MKKKANKKLNHITTTILTLSACSLLTLSGCSSTSLITGNASTSGTTVTQAVSNTVALSGGSVDSTSLFTDRDLTQTADLSDCTYITVTDETDFHVTEAGVYIISGTARNMTIYVEANSEDKVQLVLDGLSITNDDFPCIYVKTADKVFVTTSSDSSLSVTGSFKKDGDVNTDGVIFSRSDLVLNGTTTLTVSSTENGIVSKDDLKVTGGTYKVTASSKAFEAKDSIQISDGTFYLKAGTDGLHAENDDNDSLGYIYIGGGTFEINAGDDAIHATSLLQIDDGDFMITAAEGMEATYIQINGGTVTIQASDDGINAARKSNSYAPTIEFNGGTITITMGAGDTDGVDSNGDIIVNGGTISVIGNSTFDYDGTATYNGGTIIVNGQQTTTIPNQMTGGFGGNKGGGKGRH